MRAQLDATPGERVFLRRRVCAGNHGMGQRMKQAVAIIGIGELGTVFARGWLRAGHPVYPVTRDMDLAQAADAVPNPGLVLVAVAEDQLDRVLGQLPPPWRGRIGLLQNELLPRDWQAHALAGPTVVVVWFEKKRGQDAKVLLPSPIFGPRAALAAEALAALGIPTRLLANDAQLLFELVRKNLYILTVNIAGLVAGGSVAELWARHRGLAQAVARDVLAIQAEITGEALEAERLMAGLVEAIAADPAHLCTGRSAPARLQRALAHADAAGLAVPALREIAARR